MKTRLITDREISNCDGAINEISRLKEIINYTFVIRQKTPFIFIQRVDSSTEFLRDDLIANILSNLMGCTKPLVAQKVLLTNPHPPSHLTKHSKNSRIPKFSTRVSMNCNGKEFRFMHEVGSQHFTAVQFFPPNGRDIISQHLPRCSVTSENLLKRIQRKLSIAVFRP